MQSNSRLAPSPHGWDFRSDAKFSDAAVSIAESCSIEPCTGQRHISVTAQNDSYLMDAVLRFSLPKNTVRRAFIGDTEIKHQRRNKYYQHEASTVRFELQDGSILRFDSFAFRLPPGMSFFVYLRDEPGCWIFHVRALATKPERLMLKGCHRLYNGPLPNFLQNIVLKLPTLKENLLYIRERFSQRIPFQINGSSLLRSGESIDFLTTWSYE